jgi:hypothetical protein
LAGGGQPGCWRLRQPRQQVSSEQIEVLGEVLRDEVNLAVPALGRRRLVVSPALAQGALPATPAQQTGQPGQYA